MNAGRWVMAAVIASSVLLLPPTVLFAWASGIFIGCGIGLLLGNQLRSC